MADVLKLNSKSSSAQAAQVAKELARECKMIKSTYAPSSKEVIMVNVPRITKAPKTDPKTAIVTLASSAFTAVSYLLSHSPRANFMFEVGTPFGGVQVSNSDGMLAGDFVAYKSEYLETIKWVQKSDGRENCYLPAESIFLIPMMDFIKEDGETHTYSWQFFTQETSGRGTEFAVEVYSTTEAGVKLSAGFFSLDSKVGQKISTKQMQRHEVSQTRRLGKSISKSFILYKVARNCLYISPPSRLVEMNGLVKQVGYLIEHKETGKLIGPTWPFPASPGFFNSEKGYVQADRLLENIIQETAAEMAERERALLLDELRRGR